MEQATDNRYNRSTINLQYLRQCSAVQCSAVQCSAVQCSAVQCSAVQCSAVQCSAVQCSAVIKYRLPNFLAFTSSSHSPKISTQWIRIIMLCCGSSSAMFHSNSVPEAAKRNRLLIWGYLPVHFQKVWQLLIISLLPCFLVIWVQPLTMNRLTDDKVWAFFQSEIPPAWSTKLKTWTQKTSSCYPSIAPQHFYFQ